MSSSVPASAHRSFWLALPILVLVVYSIYLAALWPAADNHLFGYIGFGKQFVDPAESVIPSRFISSNSGYDGQFYYRLTLDPFSTEERVQGIRFDHPPWRQQRILLPVLTWSIARGDPELSVTVMLTINLLAVAALTLAGGALLRHHGLPPWPAVLLSFYPGFAISVERFLTEPLSFLLLLLSLLSLVHKRFAWGGILLALAVLARETALAAALAMAGIWFLQSVANIKFNRWRAPGPAYWLPAIVTYIAWQAYLLNTWSASAYTTSENGGLLVWPLTGLASSFVQLITEPDLASIFYMIMMATVIAWVVTVARVFHASRGPYRWMWLAYLALATLLGTAIWSNSPGFVRITTELNLLGMLMYLLVVQKPHRMVLTAWLGCWLLTAGTEGYHLYAINHANAAPGTTTVSILDTPLQSALMSHPPLAADIYSVVTMDSSPASACFSTCHGKVAHLTREG